MDTSNASRERLIQAGIRELELHGVQGFSVRKVASACGMSCAAPYKHFADKQDFILAIIGYINEQWYLRQSRIAQSFEGNPRRQLIEISMDYIFFLVENPQFRSVIMLRDNSMNAEQKRLQRELSQCTQRLIRAYCDGVRMPPDVERRKTYVVRSLIYGASLMLDNGDLEACPQTYRLIRESIEREFELQ